jgi:hypothetical protein
VLVVAGTALLQLALLGLPATRRLFQLADLSIGEATLPMLFGLLPVTFVECAKLVRRLARRPRNSPASTR